MLRSLRTTLKTPKSWVPTPSGASFMWTQPTNNSMTPADVFGLQTSGWIYPSSLIPSVIYLAEASMVKPGSMPRTIRNERLSRWGFPACIRQIVFGGKGSMLCKCHRAHTSVLCSPLGYLWLQVLNISCISRCIIYVSLCCCAICGRVRGLLESSPWFSGQPCSKILVIQKSAALSEIWFKHGWQKVFK